jgi:hypothetical protein
VGLGLGVGARLCCGRGRGGRLRWDGWGDVGPLVKDVSEDIYLILSVVRVYCPSGGVGRWLLYWQAGRLFGVWRGWFVWRAVARRSCGVE